MSCAAYTRIGGSPGKHSELVSTHGGCHQGLVEALKQIPVRGQTWNSNSRENAQGFAVPSVCHHTKFFSRRAYYLQFAPHLCAQHPNTPTHLYTRTNVPPSPPKKHAPDPCSHVEVWQAADDLAYVLESSRRTPRASSAPIARFLQAANFPMSPASRQRKLDLAIRTCDFTKSPQQWTVQTRDRSLVKSQQAGQAGNMV